MVVEESVLSISRPSLRDLMPARYQEHCAVPLDVDRFRLLCHHGLADGVFGGRVFVRLDCVHSERDCNGIGCDAGAVEWSSVRSMEAGHLMDAESGWLRCDALHLLCDDALRCLRHPVTFEHVSHLGRGARLAFARTTPSRDTWLALAASTCGMLLVYAAATDRSSDLSSHPHYLPQWAIPIAAVASFFSGIALIGLHKVKSVDPRAVVVHFSAVSTGLCLISWIFLPSQSMQSPTDQTSLVRLIGVGVTAMLGQLFLTKAFAAGRPARISVVGLSQVAVAASYKWIAEGRVPSPIGFLGMLMVIAATVWVMLRNQVAD